MLAAADGVSHNIIISAKYRRRSPAERSFCVGFAKTLIRSLLLRWQSFGVRSGRMCSPANRFARESV